MAEIRRRRGRGDGPASASNAAAEEKELPSSQLEVENQALREKIEALERAAQRATGEEDGGDESSEESSEEEEELTEEERTKRAIEFARRAASLNVDQKLGRVDKFFLGFGACMVLGSLLFIFSRIGHMVYETYLS